MARTNFDFVISLKRPDYRAVDWISKILLLLFMASFFYYVINSGFGNGQYWLAAIPLLIAGLWLYGYVRSAKPDFVVYYRLELMIAALGWFFIPLFDYSQLLGYAYAFMAIAERYIKFPDEIGFTKEKVVRNTFPSKTYQWFEIENVVIRDNLFTLDLRNNKLIQKPLDEAVSPELEKEFNEYCRNQLHFVDIGRQT
ncbi:MAG: hypothetical protein MUE71_01285 [Chitinophagaceae bacterium]|jgi:hypothetical protein|nr:hypothetical protein [Chitinophagaceae bacterium]